MNDLTGHSPAQQQSLYPRLAKPREAAPLLGLGHLIMYWSYVCALIAMTVWSITYHSWLTFALLFWTSLCAATPVSHAPLALQPSTAIWTSAVWPTLHRPGSPAAHHPGLLCQLGLEPTHFPCLDLRAMFPHILIFWLLLHQLVKEKLLKKAKAVIALMEGGHRGGQLVALYTI